MKYLNKEQFFEKFLELDTNTKNDFFKLETLSEYSEFDVQNWSNIPFGKMKELISKVQNGVFKQKEDNEKLISKGVILNRVRYVQFPLSKYALSQFSAYTTAQSIGENIFIIEELPKDIEDKYFTDFLLFDESKVLIHDYKGGELIGAHFSDMLEEVEPYKKVKQITKRLSIPFNEFLDCYNLTIKDT